MANKPDIVSLRWTSGLMNEQAEHAEKALVEYSKDVESKQALLQCMWSVHQITSTLRALGMKKGEMLTLEMERSLNGLYKDEIPEDRRKLTMGGLMQAIKILPAYLAHTQSTRKDTGQGLEQHINELRRWVGERPRPKAYFFHLEFEPQCGISPTSRPAPDQQIIEQAGHLLVPYLEMAKSGLKQVEVRDSMIAVARIANRMQRLFAGTEAERFWFTLIGICEGIAGGMIAPDQCLAQIFKTGAFMIKYARENGAQLDPAVDLAEYQQQMLYYIAASKARPVFIGRIRESFGIDEHTLAEARRGLIHTDAIATALGGALEQLDSLVAYFNSNDLAEAARSGEEQQDSFAQDTLEAARCRLDASGQTGLSDALQDVSGELNKLYSGGLRNDAAQLEQAVDRVIRGIVDVKLDVEQKLAHGLNSSFSGREMELRESVVSATFRQMSLVENQLHHILRRKALAAALARKPNDEESLLRLCAALHRYLNKSDQGHEELRRVLRDAENGDPDLDLLYELSREFLNGVEELPDRKALEESQRTLGQIAGALGFAGMEREGQVMERCQYWLAAASKAGEVREDDAFRCFADAFAHIELHLQRSIMDPLDDTSHLLELAEKRVDDLRTFIPGLSRGSDVAGPAVESEENYVEDAAVPAEIRQVFIEESDEIVQELIRLSGEWQLDPQANEVLRDIRRHFHTFKGNGRAVGANVLGELGWAAQDMLDHVLDGDLKPDQQVQALVIDVVQALPELVASYREDSGLDIARTRELTNRCFSAATGNTQAMPIDAPRSPVRLVTGGHLPGHVSH